MKDLISIIIPVYNASQYLEQCVNSILHQTYTNLEIILIDDCSTDNSYKICKNFTDNRIKVFHLNKNSGQSAARNLGLRKAQGTWITFVDNDDYIDCDMYQTLLDNAHKYETKISGCSHEIITHNRNKIKYPKFIINGVNSSEKYLENALYRPAYSWINVWDKLYHCSLIKYLIFPEGKQCEDFFVNMKAFSHTKTFAFIDRPFYKWCRRSTSQGNKYFMKNRETCFDVFTDIRKYIESLGKPNLTQAAYVYEFQSQTYWLNQMLKSKNKETHNLAKELFPYTNKLRSIIKPSKHFKLHSYLADIFLLEKIKHCL